MSYFSVVMSKNYYSSQAVTKLQLIIIKNLRILKYFNINFEFHLQKRGLDRSSYPFGLCP